MVFVGLSDGSRRRVVEFGVGFEWLCVCVWVCLRERFCSSGGRLSVGGLLAELSGVKPGIALSGGIDDDVLLKSHFSFPGLVHGGTFHPGIKAGSHSEKPKLYALDVPPLKSQPPCCGEASTLLLPASALLLPSSVLCLFFGRPICFCGE